jgi:branched-chain amino acid transport system ATP-binding protein
LRAAAWSHTSGGHRNPRTAHLTDTVPLLEVEGLARSFGGLKAVDSVSFALHGAPIAGLIGPNGAGKTTLFNLLAGALRPDAGRIRLLGRDLTGLAPSSRLAAGIGRTFQIPRPFPAMTVLENALLGGQGQHGERWWAAWTAAGRVAREERALRERAMTWLRFLDLDGLAHEPARVLSGGQRKLLELARVLVAGPRLILLDEPGAGVNPALLAKIVAKLRELNTQGYAFLVIEHNLDLVMEACAPILVMAGGRLILEGDAAAVRADPRVADAWLGRVAA